MALPSARVLTGLSLVVFVVTIALGAYVKSQGYRVDASTDSLVLEDDPDALRYDRTRLLFSSDEFVLVALTRDDLFTPDGVAAVASLHERFKAIPGVQDVSSIVNVALFRSWQRQPAMPRPGRLRARGIDLEKAKEELTHHELYAGNYVSKDGRTAGIVVSLVARPDHVEAGRRWIELLAARGRARDALAALPEGAAEPVARASRALADAQAALDEFRPAYARAEDERKAARIDIIREVRDVVARAKAGRVLAAPPDGAPEPPPGPPQDVCVSGVPSIVVEMVEAIQKDLAVFSLISIGLIVLFLAAVFRRAQWVVLPLLPTGATVTGTIALMYALGKRVTVITANVPSLLLAIGVAHSLHIIVRWRELQARMAGAPREERALQLIRELLAPCAFSAFTTMVGFACLHFTGSRPIKDFSLLMTFGTGLALVLSFIIMPGLLAVLPELAEGRLERSSRLLEGAARGSLRHPWLVGLLSIGLAVAGIEGMRRLEIEARFIDYFAKGSPIHQGLTALDERLGGTTGIEVVLTSGPGAFGPLHPENLDAAADVATWLRARGEVGVVMSYTGVIDEMKKLRPEASRREVAFTLGQLMGSGAVSKADVDDYVVLDEMQVEGRDVKPYSVVRVVARVRETDPKLRRLVLLQELHDFLDAKFPAGGSIQAEVTGMFMLYANMLKSLSGSHAWSSLLCLALISAIVSALFRHAGAGLLALAPSILPILVALGAMGWSGVPLDMATIMVASVSLGIGVDSAIHYLFRYRTLEVPKDGDVAAALVRTNGSIGTSIFYTSLTSVVGFAALAASEFRPNAYFGILTGLAMLAALFTMLTLLPVLARAIRLFAREGPEASSAGRDGVAAGEPAPAASPSAGPSAPTGAPPEPATPPVDAPPAPPPSP